MKKKRNLLLILAMTMSLGLATSGVSAATECAANETEHTNYYLFLDALAPSYISEQITAGNGQYGHYTGANFANNINKGTIIENGTVNIKSANDATSDNGGINWTVTEFWQKYSNAVQGANSTTLMYTPNDAPNTTYLTHSGWYAFSRSDFSDNPEEKEPGSDNQTRNGHLKTYLLENYNNIGSSDLVTKSTALPNTRFVADISAISTSVDTQFMIKVARTYETSDTNTSIENGASTLGGRVSGSDIRTYGPAAFYIKFCKANSEPVTSAKKLVYKNGNTEYKTIDLESDANTVNVGSGVTAPTQSNYTFVGWGKDSTSAYTQGESVRLTSLEHTNSNNTDYYYLYAVWKENEQSTRKVVYKSADGDATYNGPISISNDAKTIKVGEGVNPELAEWGNKELSGFHLSGWSVVKKGQTGYGPDYTDGQTAQLKSLTPEKKDGIEYYYFYAVWDDGDPTQTNFKVEYNANGGDDAPATQTGYRSSDNSHSCVPISDVKPKLEGSSDRFKGWSTDPKATKADDTYKAGAKYCGEKGDIKLFAVWENPNSPKTGVATNILAFTMIATAAGAGLYVAKKKNLFKQI